MLVNTGGRRFFVFREANMTAANRIRNYIGHFLDIGTSGAYGYIKDPIAWLVGDGTYNLKIELSEGQSGMAVDHALNPDLGRPRIKVHGRYLVGNEVSITVGKPQAHWAAYLLARAKFTVINPPFGMRWVSRRSKRPGRRGGLRGLLMGSFIGVWAARMRRRVRRHVPIIGIGKGGRRRGPGGRGKRARGQAAGDYGGLDRDELGLPYRVG